MSIPLNLTIQHNPLIDQAYDHIQVTLRHCRNTSTPRFLSVRALEWRMAGVFKASLATALAIERSPFWAIRLSCNLELAEPHLATESADRRNLVLRQEHAGPHR